MHMTHKLPTYPHTSSHTHTHPHTYTYVHTQLREELSNARGINDFTADETTKLLLENSHLQQVCNEGWGNAGWGWGCGCSHLMLAASAAIRVEHPVAAPDSTATCLCTDPPTHFRLLPLPCVP